MSEPAPPPEGEEGRIESMAEMSAKIDRLFELVGKGSHEPAAEPDAPADPKAEMRAELAKLQRAEKAKHARQAEKDATDARFKAIEDKVKEKPPEEYSRVTNWMGWRDKREM